MSRHLLEVFETGCYKTLLSGSGHVGEEIYGNNKKPGDERSGRDVESLK